MHKKLIKEGMINQSWGGWGGLTRVPAIGALVVVKQGAH